ncbi:adenosine deaminase-like [Haemaphysalis longicornis]
MRNTSYQTIDLNLHRREIRKKGLDLGYTSVEDVKEKTKPKEGTTLENYLKEVFNFVRTIVGDSAAMERVAYEAGVDQASEGVIYSEMRLAPQLLASSTTVLLPPLQTTPATMACARDVVDAALEGLHRAECQTGAKLRLILTCVRGMPEWAPEVLDLCREYSGRGVVGIDVCGVGPAGAGGASTSQRAEYGEEVTDPVIVETFQRAASCGIHRTAHAGEAGPAASVMRAVRDLRAERIGHGYRAVMEGAYEQALYAGVHFECCPTSSFLTGAVPRIVKEHPVVTLRRAGASFSLSTDNPAVTHTTLEDEYRLALRLGLTHDDILQCNRSAISACFLQDDEKWELQRKFERLISAATTSS